MSTTRIIFGCGYLGRRVAHQWRDDGDFVLAVTRSSDRATELFNDGIGASIADVTNVDSLESELGELGKFSSLFALRSTSALFAVGYDRHSNRDIHAVYAGGLQNVLAALPPSISRFIYISTTGVYGPADGGAWVDEQTPPDPQRDGGRASLAAEHVLAEHPLAQRSAILRLAGIYGPGRIPYLDKLRTGEPLPVPTSGWLNLIHVDDAARIVVAVDRWLATREAPDGPHVFCVSDGSPVVRADYYAEVARLVGAPPPWFVDPPPNSPAAARAYNSRRINSEKVWRELGLTPRYASYREGLAATLHE